MPPAQHWASSNGTFETTDGPFGRQDDFRSCIWKLRQCSLSQELGYRQQSPKLPRITGASEEAVVEASEAGQSYRTSSIDFFMVVKTRIAA